jgi:hypothetical protein
MAGVLLSAVRPGLECGIEMCIRPGLFEVRHCNPRPGLVCPGVSFLLK